MHPKSDLYKHAFRLTPLIPSELVADAFALAWDIRILDMSTAPYDFSGVALNPGDEEWTPVAIETPRERHSTSTFADEVAAHRNRRRLVHPTPVLRSA